MGFIRGIIFFAKLAFIHEQGKAGQGKANTKANAKRALEFTSRWLYIVVLVPSLCTIFKAMSRGFYDDF